MQLLFADAASGARSPALVRQGQIGEIIAARPQARRRILEDAAGIAGLHSRRHEAELRLKAAEDNLTRVEDVLRHLEAQVESLGKQARQAVRYKDIAAHIRRAEALLMHLAVLDARAQLITAERQFEAETRVVAERTRLQGEAARALAVVEHAIQPLREEESRRAAALQRLQIAREQVDEDERRAKTRFRELSDRLAELERDRDRGRQTIEDAERSLAALAAEAAALRERIAADATGRPAAAEHLAHVEADLGRAEQALSDAQGALADLSARRQAAERAARDAAERFTRAEAQLAQADRELAAINEAAGVGDLDGLRGRFKQASEALAAAESAAAASEARAAAAREAETKARPGLAEAERASQRLDTEIRTLRKLLDGTGGDLWPPVLEEISADKGYEVALGAALGDDLDASSNPSAPAHWAMVDAGDDPGLPPQAEPLAARVKAPPALARRLAQIGIVSRGEGAALRRLLKPGQRLVSREGDIWRWDGFTAAAEAPSAAARRLAEKNRLGEMESSASAARERHATLKDEFDGLAREAKAASAAEQEARAAVRARRQEADMARDVLAAAERKDAERAARLNALADNRARLAANREEAAAARAAAQKTLDAFQPDAELAGIVAERRTAVAQRRADATEARAALQAIDREVELREGGFGPSATRSTPGANAAIGRCKRRGTSTPARTFSRRSNASSRPHQTISSSADAPSLMRSGRRKPRGARPPTSVPPRNRPSRRPTRHPAPRSPTSRLRARRAPGRRPSSRRAAPGSRRSSARCRRRSRSLLRNCLPSRG